MIFQFSDSNSSKGALLISIINKYCKVYAGSLNGEIYLEKEVSGGAKISKILGQFRQDMDAMKPFSGLTDQAISMSIRNVCGLSHSLVISDKAFEVLVKKEIESFRTPCFDCLTRVMHELRNLSKGVFVPELEVMGHAKTAIREVMEGLLYDYYKPTEKMIN